MQEVINKEIDDMLAMGVIERSEAPYASPLVLVKKPDGTYISRRLSATGSLLLWTLYSSYTYCRV